jgi:putative endonuclease
MNTNKQIYGAKGEDLAVSFLRKKGYKILERNYRIRGGEIDIIALDGDTLAFVEVKARSSEEFGSALEAITYWKLKALIRAAQVYKSKHKNLPEALRIDAVAILFDKDYEVSSIELVKNISL